MNIQMPTHNEIHAAFSKWEAAIVDLFDTVGQMVIGLASQLGLFSNFFVKKNNYIKNS